MLLATKLRMSQSVWNSCQRAVTSSELTLTALFVQLFGHKDEKRSEVVVRKTSDKFERDACGDLYSYISYTEHTAGSQAANTGLSSGGGSLSVLSAWKGTPEGGEDTAEELKGVFERMMLASWERS